jgi:Domain of unknown function (DUF5069)
MNLDEPLRTKNLAEEEPAAMDDSLGGYPWLPRMIDKARASRAGILGDYFKYPCPIDRHCLTSLAISAEVFAEIALVAATGREVLRNLAAAGVRTVDEAAFDPVKFNEELHAGS